MGVPQRKMEAPLPCHPLDGVETAFYVWKAKPLAEFPWYQRWIIRTLYTLFGWSCGDTMEGLAIVRTEDEAREIVRHYRGGNAQEFPVASSIEESLPDKPIQFGKRLPADAGGARYYQKHKLRWSYVPTDKMNELIRSAAKLQAKLK